MRANPEVIAAYLGAEVDEEMDDEVESQAQEEFA
ncbi:hypothetical protein LP417_20370 [Polaromonas sp. P1-6]|nr:hypothetical protein LP417_20370 [Polaromonas sp. P1-6]